MDSYGNKSQTFLLHPWQSVICRIQIYENDIKSKLTLTQVFVYKEPGTYMNYKDIGGIFFFLGGGGLVQLSFYILLSILVSQTNVNQKYSISTACIFPALLSQLCNISSQKSELRRRTWRQHVSNDGQWRQYLLLWELAASLAQTAKLRLRAGAKWLLVRPSGTWWSS